MRVIKNIQQLQKILQQEKTKNKKIGFVPTMGAFHQGHLSLMKKCRQQNDIAVVSIFVNPTQFGPQEDLKAYPRNKKNDLLLAKKENIDIIFYPSVKDIYPRGYLTYINVADLTTRLCGKFRPNHFQGVTTIVGKLLNIVSPHNMYLGQKDAQQCVIIKQMVCDLNFPVKVRILPTVRESDGLAMSSRNKYLDPRERQQACILYKSLLCAKKMIKDGERRSLKIQNFIKASTENNSSGKVDYISCVDAHTLKSSKELRGTVLIALAVRFGKARLIDNIIVKV